MTLHLDEQARELASQLAEQASYWDEDFGHTLLDPEKTHAIITNAFARVRLAEAEWWNDFVLHMHPALESQAKPCGLCKRIASLRQAAAQPGDTAEGGER